MSVQMLYFDCQSGISGGMAVGAFLDMGLDLRALARELSKMKLPVVYDIESEKVSKGGVEATAFHVIVDMRREICSLEQMKEWVSGSELAASVKMRTLRSLGLLEEARVAVYGENGRWLSLHDAVSCAVHVTAVSVCVGWLGAETVICSPLTEGSGFAETCSGFMRLPVPTVMELARAAGAPFEICPEKTQLITETGAAIVCSLAQKFASLPSMTVEAIGFGAGSKDLDTRANVFRVISGKNQYRFFGESVCVIESESVPCSNFWQCLAKERK